MAFEVTDENLEELKVSNKVVLVDVWAEWCGPCKILVPVIDELAEDNKDVEGVLVGKANVDETAGISETYKIRSIPTVLVFKNGEVVETIIGAHPKKKYQDLLDKHNNDVDGNFDGDEDF